MGKILKGLSAPIIAIIAIIVIIIAAVGIYYGVALTSHHVTPTTSVSFTTTTTTTPTVTTTVPSKTTIVFYTWWGPGDSGVPLQIEIQTFDQAYPQYAVEPETVSGGAGVNAVPAVISLIKAGKPPDTVQALYGPMMYSFASAFPGGVPAGLKGFINWTPYYEAHLAGNVIPEVFEAGALNGTLLSMPLEVHTTNVLYINLKVLRHYNLPIPTNLSQLINDTLQLVNDGFYNSSYAPWAIGGAEGGWEEATLWQNIFLALGGPKLYDEFSYGILNLSDPHVLNIINETNEIFALFAKYDYPGWESMSQTQVLPLLISGHVAFISNGDWITELCMITLIIQ